MSQFLYLPVCLHRLEREEADVDGTLYVMYFAARASSTLRGLVMPDVTMDDPAVKRKTWPLYRNGAGVWYLPLLRLWLETKQNYG